MGVKGYIMRRLMAIDGNSLMHRAFYAMPVLNNKKGVITNAVFGFTNMLLKLINDYNPDSIVVAFDRKAPTFRHKKYESYKATRQKAPEELYPQFDLLHELLRAFKIDICELDGFEADDLLGTLSRKAEKSGFETLLVTGDRDALQLITENTKVLITRKGISETHMFDLEEIQRVYGLRPPQIVDMKGLMGDSSDNIPGVPGIGEKTALKLLHQFGRLEAVLEHIDEISGKKLKENLALYHDQALLSKDLAEIRVDAPIEIEIGEGKYQIPKTPELKAILEELEFQSLIDKLDLTGVESNTTPLPETRESHKELMELHELTDLKCLVDELVKEEQITFILGRELTLYAGGSRVYKLFFKEDLLGSGMDYFQALSLLKPIFEDKRIKKVTHDAKRAMRELGQYEIELNGLVLDTFIAAYLLDSTRSKYEIEQLIYAYLKIDTVSADAMDLHDLYLCMRKQLEETDMLMLYETVEHPLIRVLADMEAVGFQVDKRVLKELDVAISKEVEQLTKDICSLVGETFNLNSPKQLSQILFEKLGLPAQKKTKTGYSTDIEVLEQLKNAHPVVNMIIDYRQVMKLKSTYIDGLWHVIGPDERIHSSFNQTVTATGRISSTEPNLQNIPVRMEMGRNIRRAFIASSPEHVLVDADYSQIELRVLAHISQDPTFIEAFANNQDIHRRTASEIFRVPMDEVTEEQRNSAKAVNFGIVYGISDFGLSRNLGIPRAQAKLYIDNYLDRYPKVREYMERIIVEGKKQGYVTTLLNRRRYLPELQSRNHNIRSFGERVALNTPIQGTAADIIKIAMVAVYRELKKNRLKSTLILQVHDELIIDTLISELEIVKALVKEQMENALHLSVPLVAEIGVGYSWYDAK
jgi:DNA polymerase-1